MKDWTLVFHKPDSVWSTTVKARSYEAAKAKGNRIAKEPSNRGSVLKSVSTVY